ncbi:hypothetical protein J2Y69_000081 [Microbacterium resistens]|uniref:TNT domain-containing protein n=1 Tax=Microbacterium resistens TaxID=156977 RepID=A0ABU1S7A6_9MICO|nr:TNT domain-containing protein [Microbacterium resistens]MDR6865499.1 hypothetical protein [Microbacterium resistens]
MNVVEIGTGVVTLATSEDACAQLWNQLTTPSTITSVLDWIKGAGSTVTVVATTQVRSVLEKLRGRGHVGNLKRDDGLQDIGGGGESSRHGDPQVQALRDTLEGAVQQKNLPGYDPTGGLGWERFMDKYVAGFDGHGHAKWNWPDNPPHTNGFMNGISKPADLVPGDRIERITFVGKDGEALDGSFAAPPGTTFDRLSLPPDRLGHNTTVLRYEILKPLPDDIRMGEIAPGFEQAGRGTQYHFPRGIQDKASLRRRNES